MVASLIELMGEAYVFAESRGVDPSIITNMFKQFMPAASEYIDRISTRDFGRAGFTLDGGTKDVTLILEAAAEVHAPLSYASVVRDKCLAAKARGMGQLDWSCLTGDLPLGRRPEGTEWYRIASATMGFAHSGTAEGSHELTIRPRRKCKRRRGSGMNPA